MAFQASLTELAQLKLKADIYKQLYDEKATALKQQLKDKGESLAADPETGLSLTLRDQGTRNFIIDNVRKILGEAAKECIEESVASAKFDKIVKEQQITEEQLKKCYTKTPRPSLCWDGLEAFKEALVKKTQETQNG